ncbi:MAG: XrtA/PEP-CTERM system TPR-repeat protein PrsT [Pseudomonadota bacterium]
MDRTVSATFSTLRKIAAAMLVAAALAGCGLSDAERLERAKTAYAERDFRTAAIDARAVLQSDSTNTEARALLGRAALAQGDAATAEEALRRAIDGGAAGDELRIELAQALLAQRKFTELLADVSPDSTTTDDGKFSIRLARADAQLGLELTRTARSVYEELLEERPDSSPARFGIVSSYLVEEDFRNARSTVNALLSQDPDFVVARLASGSLALQEADIELARAEFERARLAAESGNNRLARADALAGLIETYFIEDDIDAAAELLAELEEIAPRALTTRYLKARIAFLRGDYPATDAMLGALLRDAPTYTPANLVAAASQLRQGNLGQAETYATSALRDSPASEEALLLLSEILLRQGRGADVAELVGPAVDNARNRDALLGVAIRAGLQTGQYDSTIELLRERAAAEPDNTDAALELAGALMAAGQFDAAETVLAGVTLESEQDQVRKEALAVYARLKQGNTAAAILQAEGLVRKLPESADARLLLGNTALAAARVDIARKSFEDAIGLAPNRVNAYLTLAAIERQAGNRDGARTYLQRAVDNNPESVIAAIRLAKLDQSAGDTVRATQTLESIIAAQPDAAAARLALAEIQLGSGDFEQALATATTVTDKNPADASAQNIRGVAMERLGRHADAAQRYADAVAADTDNDIYRINAARAYSVSGDGRQAMSMLTGTSGEVPLDNLRLATAVASLRASSGDRAGALDVVRKLRDKHPSNPGPLAVEARLLAAGGDFAAASAVYDEALPLSRYDRGLTLLAHNVRTAGGIDEPEAPLLDYLARRPTDVPMITVLGQSFANRGLREEAIDVYERAREAAPNSVTLINNLAWEYAMAGDPRAEQLARRGYELDPGNANVIDTLGWTLVRNGKLDEGILRLREALALADGQPEIRYHLAAGLIQSGQRAEGRAMLEQALASGQDFAGRAEAEQLLSSL